jgi:hypothetical protein
MAPKKKVNDPTNETITPTVPLPEVFPVSLEHISANENLLMSGFFIN